MSLNSRWRFNLPITQQILWLFDREAVCFGLRITYRGIYTSNYVEHFYDLLEILFSAPVLQWNGIAQGRNCWKCCNLTGSKKISEVVSKIAYNYMTARRLDASEIATAVPMFSRNSYAIRLSKMVCDQTRSKKSSMVSRARVTLRAPCDATTYSGSTPNLPSHRPPLLTSLRWSGGPGPVLPPGKNRILCTACCRL